MIWEIIGWLAWALVAYVAVTFAYGCRVYAASGEGFQWATAIQTFFSWCIALAFLVGPWNKLHILWLGPLAYLAAPYLVLARIPVLSPVVMFVTRSFMAVVLAGVKKA